MKSFTFRRTEADYYMDENNHSVWGFQETTIKADNKAQAWIRSGRSSQNRRLPVKKSSIYKDKNDTLKRRRDMYNSINDFTQINRNLWKKNSKYYRLTGMGITPNGCWIIAPTMIELIDIDAATGNDIYGAEVIKFDATGTVMTGNEYVNV